MACIGVDLGGTKLCLAVFRQNGELICIRKVHLDGRAGHAVGKLMTAEISLLLEENRDEPVEAIGISVPGISRSKSGTVWAPNIPGWADYPLLQELKTITGNIPVSIDSDRACSILGEAWQGHAKGVCDAIFLAVGTGIGAGIMTNGTILRGAHDIAGAIGWMTLGGPYQAKYESCGFFEYHASGNGIVKLAKEMIASTPPDAGLLKSIAGEELTAADVFTAYSKDDSIAIQVIQLCIEYWGMASANLISLFNPEKIIFGGGVFGPAVSLIPQIKTVAVKWAQPVAATQVKFLPSALGDKAGVYGAGFLAMKTVAASVNIPYE